MSDIRFGARDKLEAMMAAQRELQELMPPLDRGPGRFRDDAARAEYIRDMTLACLDELHEALGEVGWKPWATSRHLNRDAFVGELVDAWHCLMNLLLAADVSADELARRYFEKRERNVARQRNGYDGVSEKCPRCHRDLEEAARYGSPCGAGWCGVYGSSELWAEFNTDPIETGNA